MKLERIVVVVLAILLLAGTAFFLTGHLTGNGDYRLVGAGIWLATFFMACIPIVSFGVVLLVQWIRGSRKDTDCP